MICMQPSNLNDLVCPSSWQPASSRVTNMTTPPITTSKISYLDIFNILASRCKVWTWPCSKSNCRMDCHSCMHYGHVHTKKYVDAQKWANLHVPASPLQIQISHTSSTSPCRGHTFQHMLPTSLSRTPCPAEVWSLGFAASWEAKQFMESWKYLPTPAAINSFSDTPDNHF